MKVWNRALWMYEALWSVVVAVKCSEKGRADAVAVRVTTSGRLAVEVSGIAGLLIVVC